ncbi:hypothetical protein [Bacteroides acidifaciens]|uniref:hypothetical protein n=1 Tax=Bacteroides acidifaciens TaxID=85831 RepID=UPI0025ADFF17|nr:hypothetical protein [Bacteroides acidifaciens]
MILFLFLTTARPSTAYFVHGFTGSMAALSSRIKNGYTAPPIRATRFSRSVLHRAYPLHIRGFPRSDIPICA